MPPQPHSPEIASDRRQPRAKPIWLGERVKPLAGDDERLLREIIGVLSSVCELTRDPPDHAVVASHKFIERRQVSAPGPAYQLGAVAHSPQCSTYEDAQRALKFTRLNAITFLL
jgi:hypothetical protein